MSFNKFFRGRAPLGARHTATVRLLRTGPATRMQGLERPTVWSEFTPLANECNAVNLGQGYPDWKAPDFAKDLLGTAVKQDHNQYTRSQGHPELVRAIAKHSSAAFERELNPDTNVVCTVGATEGLYLAMQSLINPGDEVILLEPAMDIYAAQVQLAGGKVVPVRFEMPDSKTLQDKAASGEDLHANDVFKLDLEQLRRKITAKTRAIVLNTPQNPTGKVFSRQELEALSKVILEHEDLLVFSDEVYQHIVYNDDGNNNEGHVHIATLPGMWDRTLTFSSAAKTFSVTGWKVGWCIGDEKLLSNLAGIGQWAHFCVSTCTQEALARVLEGAQDPMEGHDNYYKYLQHRYQGKRDMLVQSIKDAGMIPIVPNGGIFVLTNTSTLDFADKDKFVYPSPATGELPVTHDWAMCRWMTRDVGVAAIPPSAFCSTDESKQDMADYIRLSFCKSDSMLDTASARMKSNIA